MSYMPPRPNNTFLFITVLVVLFYCLTALADPYQDCNMIKKVKYEGKEIISAEVSFTCETKHVSIDIQKPDDYVIENTWPVVSLTDFYNDWMN